MYWVIVFLIAVQVGVLWSRSIRLAHRRKLEEPPKENIAEILLPLLEQTFDKHDPNVEKVIQLLPYNNSKITPWNAMKHKKQIVKIMPLKKGETNAVAVILASDLPDKDIDTALDEVTDDISYVINNNDQSDDNNTDSDSENKLDEAIESNEYSKVHHNIYDNQFNNNFIDISDIELPKNVYNADRKITQDMHDFKNIIQITNKHDKSDINNENSDTRKLGNGTPEEVNKRTFEMDIDSNAEENITSKEDFIDSSKENDVKSIDNIELVDEPKNHANFKDIQATDDEFGSEEYMTVERNKINTVKTVLDNGDDRVQTKDDSRNLSNDSVFIEKGNHEINSVAINKDAKSEERNSDINYNVKDFEDIVSDILPNKNIAISHPYRNQASSLQRVNSLEKNQKLFYTIESSSVINPKFQQTAFNSLGDIENAIKIDHEADINNNENHYPGKENLNQDNFTRNINFDKTPIPQDLDHNTSNAKNVIYKNEIQYREPDISNYSNHIRNDNEPINNNYSYNNQNLENSHLFNDYNLKTAQISEIQHAEDNQQEKNIRIQYFYYPEKGRIIGDTYVSHEDISTEHHIDDNLLENTHRVGDPKSYQNKAYLKDNEDIEKVLPEINHYPKNILHSENNYNYVDNLLKHNHFVANSYKPEDTVYDENYNNEEKHTIYPEIPNLQSDSDQLSSYNLKHIKHVKDCTEILNLNSHNAEITNFSHGDHGKNHNIHDSKESKENFDDLYHIINHNEEDLLEKNEYPTSESRGKIIRTSHKKIKKFQKEDITKFIPERKNPRQIVEALNYIDKLSLLKALNAFLNEHDTIENVNEKDHSSKCNDDDGRNSFSHKSYRLSFTFSK
ncbi:hypothetical protein K1T71_000553 [Dendrolimus kikuchii]|uniref:Uncharacterized protein n=1 Tax=Dendrolimus kikuchii TaxID=765133 RepID=A0ACC1DJS0_9NEOP|nr:hypothetical protein K1T71_000553 [Dendrolimus kikuchii]